MTIIAKTFSELVTFTRASSATVTDSTGTIVESGVDEPRFDHDPVTGERLGLLVEEARTNGYAASANIGVTNQFVTVNGAQINTFAKSVFTGQLATRFQNNNAITPSRSQGMGALVASPNTCSAIFEIVDDQQISFGLYDSTAAGFVVRYTYTPDTALFSLVEAPQGSGIAGAYEVISESGPNGGRLIRVFITGTPLNAGNNGVVYIYNIGETAKSVIIHHVQHEVGAFPTSPIITPVNFTSRASVANYFDENGDLQEAAVDESRPHYIYDADADEWVGGALLYEAARTNHQNNSRPAKYQFNINGGGIGNVEFYDAHALGLTGKLDALSFSRVGLFSMYRAVAGLPTSGSYTYSIYVKPDNINSAFRLYVDAYSDGTNSSCRGDFDFATEEVTAYAGGATSAGIENIGSGWFRIHIVLGADSVNGASSYHIWPLTTDEIFTVWGIQVEAGDYLTSYIDSPETVTSRSSTATYFDSDGVLQTAAIDEARTAAHLYNEALGGWLPTDILREPARTNSLLHNRDLSDATWLQSGSPTLAQDQVGIDGVSNTAWTLGDDSAVAIEQRYQDVTIADDTATHTTSIYFKKTTGATTDPGFGMSLIGGTTVSKRWRFNTNDGTYVVRSTNAGDGDISVVDCGDWWRVIVTAINNGTGNTTAQVLISPAIGVTGATSTIWTTGNVGSCVVDFPQLELNATYSTSPIETTTTAVTRSADVVSSAAVTRSADVVSSSAVTRAGEVARPTTPPSTLPFSFMIDSSVPISDGTLMSLISYQNDGATGVDLERIILYRTTTLLKVETRATNGNIKDNFDVTLPAEGDRFKIAVRVADNDVAVSVNGAAIVKDGIPEVAPTGMTDMQLARLGVSGQWSAPLKSFKEYPYAMSDAELIAASTL